VLRLGFARILDVIRNLQILLEQSKLWKGELAQRHFGKRIGGLSPASNPGRPPLKRGGRDGLGKFYG
jgi:hypothetical protein